MQMIGNQGQKCSVNYMVYAVVNFNDVQELVGQHKTCKLIKLEILESNQVSQIMGG